MPGDRVWKRLHCMAGLIGPEGQTGSIFSSTYLANLALAREYERAAPLGIYDPDRAPSTPAIPIPGYFLNPPVRRVGGHRVAAWVCRPNLKLQLDFFHCQIWRAKLRHAISRGAHSASSGTGSRWRACRSARGRITGEVNYPLSLRRARRGQAMPAGVGCVVHAQGQDRGRAGLVPAIPCEMRNRASSCGNSRAGVDARGMVHKPGQPRSAAHALSPAPATRAVRQRRQAEMGDGRPLVCGYTGVSTQTDFVDMRRRRRQRGFAHMGMGGVLANAFWDMGWRLANADLGHGPAARQHGLGHAPGGPPTRFGTLRRCGSPTRFGTWAGGLPTRFGTCPAAHRHASRTRAGGHWHGFRWNEARGAASARECCTRLDQGGMTMIDRAGGGEE
jgi:hypothetical protein